MKPCLNLPGVIRNLGMGTERDYSLGYEYTPAGLGLPYSLQFTATSGEVMMAPAFMAGDFAFRGLQVADGALTCLTQIRQTR